MIDFGAIESAIVAALTGDATLRAQAAHIGSWQGEGSAARAAAEVVNFPAVLVVYAGGPVKPMGMAGWVTEARYEIVVHARNFRGTNQARKGTAAGDVGAYGLIQSVLRILSGKTLGMDLSELSPGEISFIQGADKAGNLTSDAIYSVPFTTRVQLDLSEAELQEPDATPPDDLESIYATHAIVRITGDVAVVTDIHLVGT